ncbi:nucleolar protein 3-like [Macrotis lagotis]|uniref:nucleolar protein 3-like n=1 Tax=Macrotis lagotis TaxID=92651 RepID=UPI003D69C474
MGNVQERPSQLIQQRRKQLVEGLKNDSSILLDGLMSRGIITESEYEALDAMDDPERRVRRLLLIVEKKGEFACQELLKCASEIHPYDSNDPYWNWRITPQGYGYHCPRSHDSCSMDDQKKISGGDTTDGVPNPAEKEETDGGEQSQDAGVVDLDTLDDQVASNDPEPESYTPENESVNEVLEEPEPQTPENNDPPECYEDPEPDYGVVDDNDEGAGEEEDF